MSWITAHAAHLVARVTVALLPPAQALKVTAYFTRRMRLDRISARHVSSVLEPWGTCLSRAVSIAARIPGAEIVLGGDTETGAFTAHAWVEIDGRPLRSWDPQGRVLARFGGDLVLR